MIFFIPKKLLILKQVWATARVVLMRYEIPSFLYEKSQVFYRYNLQNLSTSAGKWILTSFPEDVIPKILLTATLC